MDRMLKVFRNLKQVMTEFIDVFMMYIIMITPYATSRIEAASLWKAIVLVIIARILNDVAGCYVNHLTGMVAYRKEAEAVIKRVFDKRLAN